MNNTNKISARTAILICLNGMIGAGLFINPAPLTQIAGPLGFLGYVITATLMLPLILSIAALAQQHPVSGGLYVYSKQYLGTAAGFMGGWGYFVGKTATLALLSNRFILFIHRSFAIQSGPHDVFVHTCLLLMGLCLLHALGASIGGRMPYFFSSLKLIPLAITCTFGLFYFQASHFVSDLPNTLELLSLLPVAAFSLLGFEIICSIGHLIEEPSSNIRNVILRAFGLVACINTTFQVLLFGTFGRQLAYTNEPLRLFSDLSHPLIGPVINTMVFVAILGTCFAILSSNCWNLHALGRDNLLPGSRFLTKINQHHVPWVSLTIECLLGCSILLIAQDQISLQNMSVFAQICSLLLCTIAALVGTLQAPHSFKLKPWIAVGGCLGALGIMGIALCRMLASGVCLSFVSILLGGIVLAVGQRFYHLVTRA